MVGDRAERRTHARRARGPCPGPLVSAQRGSRAHRVARRLHPESEPAADAARIAPPPAVFTKKGAQVAAVLSTKSSRIREQQDAEEQIAERLHDSFAAGSRRFARA